MMPFWTAVAPAKASYIFTVSTLMSMVCSATVPAELRVKAETTLASSATPATAVPVVVLSDRKFEPE